MLIALGLYATKANSNQRLNGPFKSNVIKFRYDPDNLPPGVAEGSLRPSYYSSVHRAWVAVESFTVDQVNHIVTMHINHFTDFALTGVGGEVEYNLYLPMVLRS